MKIYELLIVYKSLFSNMFKQGISQRDIIYLDIFHEYMQMQASGLKEAKIRALLSKKYKLSASTIRKAIKRLNQTYEL